MRVLTSDEAPSCDASASYCVALSICCSVQFTLVRYDVVNGMNGRLRAGVGFKVDFMDGRDDFLHFSLPAPGIAKCIRALGSASGVLIVSLKVYCTQQCDCASALLRARF